MRKLKLDPEQLQVTSFAADAVKDERRGTVNGHNPKPSPSDAFASCSACSWVDIPCCTNAYCIE